MTLTLPGSPFISSNDHSLSFTCPASLSPSLEKLAHKLLNLSHVLLKMNISTYLFSYQTAYRLLISQTQLQNLREHVQSFLPIYLTPGPGSHITFHCLVLLFHNSTIIHTSIAFIGTFAPQHELCSLCLVQLGLCYDPNYWHCTSMHYCHSVLGGPMSQGNLHSSTLLLDQSNLGHSTCLIFIKSCFH